jgi:hypothetical protein
LTKGDLFKYQKANPLDYSTGDLRKNSTSNMRPSDLYGDLRNIDPVLSATGAMSLRLLLTGRAIPPYLHDLVGYDSTKLRKERYSLGS